VGDGSPGSREAEGEGGEGFYIAQSGRSPDLLVIGGVVWGGPSDSRGRVTRKTRRACGKYVSDAVLRLLIILTHFKSSSRSSSSRSWNF
jgi:hypothetical protein